MQFQAEITRLLNLAEQGDRSAESAILELLHKQLRHIAAARLRNERRDHTLQPTALVHEAYLSLIGHRPRNWVDRNHFLAMAGRAMRNVLVDHARSQQALCRGGQRQRVDLGMAPATVSQIDEILEIDIALNKLAQIDERQARMIEMRFFGGLTEPEIATVLGISERTVKRDWVCARAFLQGALRRQTGLA
jgi:RNA polymerase sigma factor (TIGR02999 family)